MSMCVHVCPCSCGSQRLKVADVWNVPPLCGDHLDRTEPQRQEAQVSDQVQEQQLGTQIQRDLLLVRQATNMYPFQTHTR